VKSEEISFAARYIQRTGGVERFFAVCQRKTGQPSEPVGSVTEGGGDMTPETKNRDKRSNKWIWRVSLSAIGSGFVVCAVAGLHAQTSGVSSAPIEVRVDAVNPSESLGFDHFLRVQSLIDSVTITGMSLNRGDCGKVNNINANIKFGQVRSYPVIACNPLKEVTISTDHGEWTFNLSQ
jgi:hypothetical protein